MNAMFAFGSILTSQVVTKFVFIYLGFSLVTHLPSAMDHLERNQRLSYYL